MPIVNKILAQAQPGTAATDIYTAPYASNAERSALMGLDMAADANRRRAMQGTSLQSLIVCNTGTNSAGISVAVAIAGAADANSQYIYHALTVASSVTTVLDLIKPLPLLATDVIRAKSDTGNAVFTLNGAEAQY